LCSLPFLLLLPYSGKFISLIFIIYAGGLT